MVLSHERKVAGIKAAMANFRDGWDWDERPQLRLPFPYKLSDHLEGVMDPVSFEHITVTMEHGHLGDLPCRRWVGRFQDASVVLDAAVKEGRKWLHIDPRNAESK